jgi:hypothetical protein
MVLSRGPEQSLPYRMRFSLTGCFTQKLPAYVTHLFYFYPSPFYTEERDKVFLRNIHIKVHFHAFLTQENVNIYYIPTYAQIITVILY